MSQDFQSTKTAYFLWYDGDDVEILFEKGGHAMQWTRPKSVRQIGDIPGKGRIYMEDYVIRFARQLAGQGRGEERAAVLLGNHYMYNGDKIYQISGIVEIPDFAGRSGPELSGQIWDRIYSEIKENFTDLEIVGWYYSCRGFSLNQASRLLQIHKANFQHRDKVLYIYEETGKEDSFFLYRSGQFERQKGYYIYYEKNPEMLRYMEKENNRHVHIVEQEDDRVVRNIRGIMEEKEKLRSHKKKKENRMSYGIAGMAALIAVLIGMVTLRNQTSLDQVKKQLNTLQTMNQGGQPGNQDRTVIETERAELTSQPTGTPVPSASPAVTSAAPADTAAASASATPEGSAVSD